MLDFVVSVVSSPLNCVLLVVCVYLLYKIVFGRKVEQQVEKPEPELPRMKQRDFTVEQLREYDGKGKEGRVLIAVNGKVFDVTRGKRFYGPGGPYAVFAGRDATRGLATFSLTEDTIKNEYDDISDLNSVQMESVREWEMQMTDKYYHVGRLLKPGETPRDYSDSEDETTKKDQ